MELLLARNPDLDSSLPYLLKLPIGLVFRFKDTWPRTSTSTAELRLWARSTGIDVPDRGRLRPEVLEAWRDAQT